MDLRKTIFPVLLVTLLLVGCEASSRNVASIAQQIRDTGPLKIIVHDFDYHETVERLSDGAKMEFCHHPYEKEFDEGTTVDAQYIGGDSLWPTPGHCESFDATIVSYTVKPKEMPHGSWKGNKYVFDSGKICGNIQATNDEWNADVSSGRNSLYEHWSTKQGAISAVDRECK